MKETEEQRVKREEEMKEQIEKQSSEISRLKTDYQRSCNDVSSWAERYAQLQKALAWEKHEKADIMAQLSYYRNGANSAGTEAVPLPPRQSKKSSKPTRAYHISAPADPQGCGNCSVDTKCACVDAVLDMPIASCGRCSVDHCECLQETLSQIASQDTSKRSRSRLSDQTAHTAIKRVRPSVETPPLEVDFTTQSKPMPRITQDISSILNKTSSRPPIDNCGFCTGGTFCLCEAAANAAEEEAEARARNQSSPLEYRSHRSLKEVTPPPSDSDVTFSDHTYRLPAFAPASSNPYTLPIQGYTPMTLDPPTQAMGSCSGNPGSCQGCQEDPKQALFCRSLAAVNSATTPSSTAAGGCCGGGNGLGGCCKDLTPVPAISCAATYNMLKAQPGFEKAFDEHEQGTWLPKLDKIERDGEQKYPGRPAYEVRAASVLEAIRYLDVRFAKGSK